MADSGCKGYAAEATELVLTYVFAAMFAEQRHDECEGEVHASTTPPSLSVAGWASPGRDGPARTSSSPVATTTRCRSAITAAAHWATHQRPSVRDEMCARCLAGVLSNATGSRRLQSRT